MILLLLLSVVTRAGVPDGYYDNAQGKAGVGLQIALHDIIDGHTTLSYTPGVWNAYRTTDLKADGTVWDMYSDVPDGTAAYTYTYTSDQCGNYSGEGSCYNREHSFPKSWFSEQSPMVTDLFHVVPSDGYVNSKRNNYPFGEVGSASWKSTNGSKVGACVTDGYSGTVFEPVDEYKGDFARIYFYMATRYYGEDSSWPGSAMVDGAQPEAWALAMLKRWHEADPVSEKEINRNDAIYNDWQHNRNPFVDHPEYVDSVWNGDTSIPDDTTTLDPSVKQNITMSTVDYQLIVDYVVAQGLPNTSTYDDSEYYYGASSHYTNFDIRDGKCDASFATPEAAIEESFIKVILPAYGSNSIVGSEFTISYATYDGSNGTGSMDFQCTSTDPLTFVSGLVSSNDEVELWSNVSIYPNPAVTSFSLSSQADMVKIISISGRVLISKNTVKANETISISGLASGVYFVSIHNANESVISKLVKK